MHPTHRTVRALSWGFLLAAVLAGLPSASLRAQPARTAADREVVIPIGSTENIGMKSGLKITDVNNTTPQIARVTKNPDPTRVTILGLEPGITRVTLTDEDKNKETIDVVVQTDVEYLRRMLRLATPTANIGVVPSANGGVILTGFVTRAEDSVIAVNTARMVFGDRVIDALHLGGVQQVQIDVCIVRVDRNNARTMNFTFLDQGMRHTFGSTLGLAPTAATNALTGIASSSGSLSSTPSNLFLGIVNDKQAFFGFLTALRTEGVAKLMAHPTLISLSGRPASFLDGGEQAVPVPAGLGQVGVQFEEFGTRLNFLPIVLGNGKIHLEVEPEVSALSSAAGVSSAAVTVPGRVTQRVHTTVELEPGQTYVLGGLIQHTFSGSDTKVPIVGDLPFLGTFFSAKSTTEDEFETLVIVTPYLVDAMDCSQLPKLLPGQETRTPDDFELFLEGILEAPRGQREVFPNNHYLPAYKNGPSSADFPCAGGRCGTYAGAGCNSGNCGSSGCGSGNCGSAAAGQPATNDGSYSPAPMTMPGSSPLYTPTMPNSPLGAAPLPKPLPSMPLPPAQVVPVPSPVSPAVSPPRAPDLSGSVGKVPEVPAPAGPRITEGAAPAAPKVPEALVPTTTGGQQPFLLPPNGLEAK